MKDKKKVVVIVAIVFALLLTGTIALVFTMNPKAVDCTITLNERDVAIELKETVQLQIVPDDAKYNRMNKKISWVSSEPEVATVDKNGFVTGIAGGEARITAIVKLGGGEISASCMITVKSPDKEYSTYKLHWYTQRKDRSGYDVEEEVFERLVGSKAELTEQDVTKRLPANYIVNQNKTRMTGTVQEQQGFCVLEVYYDVAEITYYVDSYYESDSALGTYPTKETKKLKAYAFSKVELPNSTEKAGFVLNAGVKASVLKNDSVVAGSRLKVYYDRIRTKVSISYASQKADAVYTNVYGVGLVDAPKDALKNGETLYKAECYVDGEKKDITMKELQQLTKDTVIDFRIVATGFTYLKDNGGTLLNTSNKAKTDSYTYLNGKDEVIYLSATYDLTGAPSNLFGVTLQSGKTSREIRFKNQGVTVMKEHTSGAGTNLDLLNAGYYKGAHVLAQNITGINNTKLHSAVADMCNNRLESSHDVIWVVWNNTLYCTVDGEISLCLPLQLLDDKWVEGTKYEIGFSAYNELDAEDDLKIRNITVSYGDSAEKKLVTDKQAKDVSVNMMCYEPFEGTYVSAATSNATYIYGFNSKENSGITANVQWENKDNTYTAVGVTVKVRDKSYQYLVEGVKSGIRRQSNHLWQNVVWLPWSVSKVPAPFGTADNCKMSAYVKDGHFYILYNDTQSLCINLVSLFPEYNSGTEVSVGLCTWDSKGGMVRFSNVEAFDKKAVDKASLKEWALFTEKDKGTGTFDNYDLVNGTVDKTTAGWKTLQLFGESDSWQIEGKFKRQDANDKADTKMGFELISGSKKIWILGSWNGFMKLVNENWSAKDIYANISPTSYAVNRKGGAFFGSNPTKSEISFRAVLHQNVFYVWLEGELCWYIPLTEETFGGFGATSKYNVCLKTTDQNQKLSYVDLKVKMGYQVTEQKNFAEDINITLWDSFNGKSVSGKSADVLTTKNKTSNEGTLAFLKGASSDVYLSATYNTLDNKATALFGISIKEGGQTREIRFRGSGVVLSSNNMWNDKSGTYSRQEKGVFICYT